MELVDEVVSLFLKPFDVPEIRLSLPRVSRPSTLVVFSVLLLTYFLVFSGIIYDLIVAPPSIGQTQDPETGAVRPQAFLEGRVNGQFLIEGFSAGFLFTCGALGFIGLDFANSDRSGGKRTVVFVLSMATVVICYFLSIVYIRKKVPGYLTARE